MIRMDHPRLTYGCLPLIASAALFGLGSYVLNELPRSVGIIGFAFGLLVLVLTAVVDPDRTGLPADTLRIHGTRAPRQGLVGERPAAASARSAPALEGHQCAAGHTHGSNSRPKASERGGRCIIEQSRRLVAG